MSPTLGGPRPAALDRRRPHGARGAGARPGSSAGRSATPCSASRSRTPTWRSSAGSEESAARAIARVAGGSAFPLSEEHATWRAVALDGRLARRRRRALRAETIEEDLRARDFTVNAIARAARGRASRSTRPAGSRTPRPACSACASEHAFREDPIRLLRAARLAARYGLAIEAGTAELARADAAQAAEPAGERQFAELRGIVAGPDRCGASS